MLRRSARELRWNFCFCSRARSSASRFRQRTLPFQTGLYAGPAASDFINSTNLKFLHKLSGFYAQDQWKAQPNLTLTLGLRYDVDFFPSASDIRLNGKMHPTNYGNVQPRVGFAYSFRQGKGVARAGFGLFTGPFDYSDIMVSWQGASAFTNMNQPILPEFADPGDKLVGLGPSGIVGMAGPFLASQAFHNFCAERRIPRSQHAAAISSGIREAQVPQCLRRRSQPGS